MLRSLRCNLKSFKRVWLSETLTVSETVFVIVTSSFHTVFNYCFMEDIDTCEIPQYITLMHLRIRKENLI